MHMLGKTTGLCWQGPVRRLLMTNPGCQALNPKQSLTGCNARVAVLFSNGHFGVWQLDNRNELKPVRFYGFRSSYLSVELDSS